MKECQPHTSNSFNLLQILQISCHENLLENLPHSFPKLSLIFFLNCALSSSSSHPSRHPSPRCMYVCVCVRSPQTLKLFSSLFFPAVFYIFIFISLYLITAIPLSISFIPSSLLSRHPSVHASNPTLAFLSLAFNPIHPLFLSSGSPPIWTLFFIRLSMKSSLFPKLYQQRCFVKIVLQMKKKTYFHSSILPSISPSTRSFIHPRFLIVSH